MNLGPADTSPTAWIGATLCNTTNWMSTTAIVCQLPAGAGKPTMITVGVASLTGSLRSWFTYYGACDAFGVCALVLVW